MNKKLELFIVKPNDDSEKTLKNFIYLERQGIKVKRANMKNKVCKHYHLKKIPCIQRNFQGCITPHHSRSSCYLGVSSVLGIGRNEKRSKENEHKTDNHPINLFSKIFVKINYE